MKRASSQTGGTSRRLDGLVDSVGESPPRYVRPVSAQHRADQTEARDAREKTKGPSPTADDELTDRLAERGAKRFAELQQRLGA